MKRKFDSIKTFAVAAVLGMTASIPAQAEDTEIYTGLNSAANGIDPNVMFIIDTSGSMGSSVTSVIAAYAPTTNYTGTCGTNGRIYFSTSGNTPSCNSSSYFNDSKFRCAAANNPLFGTNATGFYQDRVARLASGGFFSSRSRWRSLSRFDHNPTHVDCKADENIHGGDDYDAADGGGGNYIRNNTSGYTTNASNKKNWNSTGSFTTLYSANYMRYYHGSSSVVTTDRISIVKDVVKSMIDANTNLNISLMRFDTNSFGTGRNRGGPIIFPFSDIDATGVRTNFKSSIDGLSASGNTPLAETMREAARVYRGETAVSGLSPNNIRSVSTSFLNGSTTYDTPLDVQCQKNFIIYLTDGEPTADFEFDSNIRTLISGSDLPSNDTSCGGTDNCLDELAEYLNEVDQISTLNGKQNVVTYTIGFFSNQTLLSNAATKGGGQYYLADNFAALSDAFSQIITEIQAVNTTFTAPAVSVNAFNRVTNRKELFFTLFKPNSSPIWTGNLKRYELDFLLDGSGDPVDSDGDGEEDPPQVLDQNGTVAVDPQTGFFDISSTSYWTQSADSPDGDETSLGGAARLFGATPGNLTAEDPANRTVYTYTGVKTDLSEPENLVRPNTTICGSCGTNALLTAVFMDSTSTTTTATSPSLQDLIDWRAGVDIRDDNANGDNTEARQAMADPLHTKPLLVTYGSTDANPDITLFMATNDGSLHAMDVDDGTEVFTFIPPEQMAKSRTAFDNTVTGSKTYGLDGSLTLFHRDDNGDSVADDTDGNGLLDTGEQYILIVGQRRGGTRYYALDITDRLAPKYLWTILGGQGGLVPNTLSETNYLPELSQTWSTAKVAKVTLASTDRSVLIFGGGFDVDHDTTGTARTPDDSGRAVYMVDVYTGALVWWAGKPPTAVGAPDPNLDLSAMDYAIPGDIRLVDIDGDTYTDRMYAADLGGQVWRFDITNGATSANALVSATVLADLQRTTGAGAATIASNRKFFYSPDVSLVVSEDQAPFIAVALGSGNRSHPLDTAVQDRFYMIKDKNPFSKPASYDTTVYEGTLLDTTTDLSPDVSNYDGWFLQLTNGTGASVGSYVGEKVLSESVTFNGAIIFTTFTPVATTSSGSCAPNQGTGSVFAVNVADARPVQDLDTVSSSTSFTRSDRSLTLVRTGIAPEVTILFPPIDGVQPVALVAAEQLDLELNNPPVKTYWFQQETD